MQINILFSGEFISVAIKVVAYFLLFLAWVGFLLGLKGVIWGGNIFLRNEDPD